MMGRPPSAKSLEVQSRILDKLKASPMSFNEVLKEHYPKDYQKIANARAVVQSCLNRLIREGKIEVDQQPDKSTYKVKA